LVRMRRTYNERWAHSDFTEVLLRFQRLNGVIYGLLHAIAEAIARGELPNLHEDSSPIVQQSG